MLAVIIAAISVQGAVRLGLTGFIGVLLVVMCLAMAATAVSWLVTGYHVVGRELRIYDGVLVRRTRAIPLERLQAVEMVRPLLARIFGLAELRLEVVGGGKTEAPLAYLTVADAAELRERLLAIAGRVGAPVTGDGRATPPGPGGQAAGPPATGPHATGPQATAPQATAPQAALRSRRPAARDLHTVVNWDVLVSQILTPPVMFLPVGVALVVAQYVFGAGAWSLVVLASMLVAIIGIIQQPVRRVLSDWHFRLGLQESATPGHNGLQIWHGLTETRSQTVPLRRIQAVSVIWPLLWRAKKWLRVRIDVAGYGTPSEGVGSSDQLLPVGDFPTASRLVPVVLPGVDLSRLPLAGVARRARWVAPLAQPVLAAGCAEDVFATRDGRITRRLTLVPYARIQSVRVVQGPLQRALGLASVYVDTAGSATAAAAHRELSDARRLAADLTRRARRARETDPGSAGPVAEPG
jgi:putative membrane protein